MGNEAREVDHGRVAGELRGSFSGSTRLIMAKHEIKVSFIAQFIVFTWLSPIFATFLKARNLNKISGCKVDVENTLYGLAFEFLNVCLETRFVG